MGRVFGVMGLAVLGGVACTGVSPGCDNYAATSVYVSVTNAEGAPVIGAAVTWTTEDGAAGGECTAQSDGSYACGQEVDGVVVIHVERASYVSAEVSVEVPADECHVIPQSVDITLELQDCTAQEVPSVRARAEDGSGGIVPGAAVRWRRAADPAASAVDCTQSGDLDFPFLCGSEVAGDLVITATAGGYQQGVEEVTIEADYCHVITQDVTLVLSPL